MHFVVVKEVRAKTLDSTSRLQIENKTLRGALHGPLLAPSNVVVMAMVASTIVSNTAFYGRGRLDAALIIGGRRAVKCPLCLPTHSLLEPKEGDRGNKRTACES